MSNKVHYKVSNRKHEATGGERDNISDIFLSKTKSNAKSLTLNNSHGVINLVVSFVVQRNSIFRNLEIINNRNSLLSTKLYDLFNRMPWYNL